MSAPNFAKKNGWSKRRIPPQTPPPPLAKSESSRGFAETISPEKCFRKTESALYSCFRPFPFGKALCFAQRRFSATDARLVGIRILFVIGSDFVNDTPQNKDCLSAVFLWTRARNLRALHTGRADLEYICECRVFKERINVKGVP